MSENVKFDAKKTFEEEARELIDELKRICVLNRVPMAMTFAVADDGKETSYINEYISTTTVRRPLSDDRLEKYVKVYNGFNVIPEDIDTIEMM